VKKSLIRRILVAFDGSGYAYKALDSALDLAEKYSSRVTLLAVTPNYDAPLGSYSEELLKAL
jgi:nucleotide-binding universal stress UspA family protein